jgi:hypothetical protein
MALQLDIIPATGTVYHTSNIEDGVALADEELRAELAFRYPGLWQRVCTRRAFMADVLGTRLKPEVLPLSNLAGYLPAAVAVPAPGHAPRYSSALTYRSGITGSAGWAWGGGWASGRFAPGRKG